MKRGEKKIGLGLDWIERKTKRVNSWGAKKKEREGFIDHHLGGRVSSGRI
jgi:hypothetical protein